VLAQIDVPAILSATIPLAIAIIGGGLAMAWRLGGLEKMVGDLNDDVKELKGQVRDLSAYEQGKPQ
jgi:hypothetical protein